MREVKVRLDRDRVDRRRPTGACSAPSSSISAAASTAASSSPAIRPRRQEGFRGDVLELVRELGADDHALSRRQLRLRLQLGGRRRPGREAADAAWSSPGCRSSRTPSAPTSSSTGAGSPTSSRCWRSISARAGRTTRAGSSNTATTRPARSSPTSAATHGWEKPHDVKFWCLGNEVDGPWQMGSKTATEYGRVATEAAKLMRLTDPTIELAAVGSSGRNMPTFGAWEREVLEHTFDHVEFISLHTYLNDYARRHAGVPGEPRPDGRLHRGGGRRSPTRSPRSASSTKRIMLSFDEWNVWYRTRRGSTGRTMEGWPVAPPILEEVYYDEGCARLRRRLHLAPEPCRPGQGRLPRAARQRHRADPDGDRRAGLAADDLLPVRRLQQSRARHGAKVRGRLRRPTPPTTTIRGGRPTSISRYRRSRISRSPRFIPKASAC